MKIGLSHAEVMARTEGELMDLMSCYLIANGAKQKFRYEENNFMEVLRMK